MEYTVSGSAKRKVKFQCPACHSPLECPLGDAGQQFPCPTCEAVFTVPGTKEIEEQKAFDARKLKAEQVQRDRIAQAKKSADDAAAKVKEDREYAKAIETRNRLATKATSSKIPFLSHGVTVLAMLLAFALFHHFWVKPLQSSLLKAQEELQALTKMLNHNAEVANARSNAISDSVTSLRETVNHNAEVANARSAAISSSVASLRETVNHNAVSRQELVGRSSSTS